MKKTQEMMEKQERLRIPIAQGLPWTTDEPEVRLDLLQSLWWTRHCIPL